MIAVAERPIAARTVMVIAVVLIIGARFPFERIEILLALSGAGCTGVEVGTARGIRLGRYEHE